MTETLPSAALAQSYVVHDGTAFWLERDATGKHLVIASTDPAVVGGFTGSADGDTFRAELTGENAVALRAALPYLTPVKHGLATSVGFGDRLGICTPGHVRALKAVGSTLRPVFAQQSIREMGRCHRQPADVLNDATWGAFEAGWTGPVGADADHLKTTEDIDRCIAAGFVFYTFDPGDSVDADAESADAATIVAKAEALDWTALDSSLEAFKAAYTGHTIELEDETIVLDEESVVRAVAKYGPSLVHFMGLYRHIESKGIDYELEMAVDETEFPTKPAEHVVIVSELKRLGVEFVSFAPRFVGAFEKGVEFIGSLDALKRDFQLHAEIARALGPYKLSLHSGSDKYSTYPLIAEATGGIVHLKTAGTSWAEALRVIARHDPALFREMLALSLESFETNRHSYHLSCDPSRIDVTVPDDRLDDLVTLLDSRQVLHVAYGALLDAFHDRLYAVWNENIDELNDIITHHFIKHLAPFI